MDDKIPMPKRVGWGVLATAVLTGLNAAFLLGVYVTVIADHDQRITANTRAIEVGRLQAVETREQLIRIESGVAYLTERAREDRMSRD